MVRISSVNIDTVKKCRLQISLSLAEVESKVNHIRGIEDGSYIPTLAQLDTLSKLYSVPRWVFIADNLPQQYDFADSVNAFRHFSQSRPDIFSNTKIRSVTSRVSKLRDLMLELLEDLDEPVGNFSPPEIDQSVSAEEAGRIVRAWLGVTSSYPSFQEWKDHLEAHGVFVFITSKYLGWSHIDESSLRGFSVYHDVRPIIVINGSDWKKAQSFTLFHEFAHILRRESSIDNWEIATRSEELWCDDFAGAVLMPAENFTELARTSVESSDLKRLARKHSVSSFAILVRIRRLGLIDQGVYNSLEHQLRKEFEEERSKLESAGGVSRNRSSEVIQQYGKFLTSTLYQAYSNKIIDLGKLAKILDVKHTQTVFEIGSRL